MRKTAEEVMQEMIDDMSNVYDMGEDGGVFNEHTKKTPKQSLNAINKEFQEVMNYDYKSMNQLCHMSVEELEEELLKVETYNKNLLIMKAHLEKSQNHTASQASNTHLNQIKRRNHHAG